jgi:hypothetical protein
MLKPVAASADLARRTAMSSMVKSSMEQTLVERLEEFQALSSESFLRSIKEAREDYRQGRVASLVDLGDTPR